MTRFSSRRAFLKPVGTGREARTFSLLSDLTPSLEELNTYSGGLTSRKWNELRGYA
jgi:hypothetical protein